MFRVIQCRFDKCSMIKNLTPQFIDGWFHTALQLTDRTLQGIFIFRIDQVDHRLCLWQIHFPVQESSFSKFSRFCCSCTVFQNRFQHPAHYIRSTVTINFYCILSGKCPWSMHDHHKDFIHRLFSVCNMSIMNCMARHFCNLFFSPVYFICYFQSLVSAQSDDSNSWIGHPGGNSCDRILFHIHTAFLKLKKGRFTTSRKYPWSVNVLSLQMIISLML